MLHISLLIVAGRCLYTDIAYKAVIGAAASLVAVGIHPPMVLLCWRCSCFADRCWHTAGH